MSKQEDTMAILKLYELRRDEQMRAARQWYFSEFAPTSAMDIVDLYRNGERGSANFRMVTSFWDTAASLVLNGGIDQKMFLDANTEHVFVYTKIGDGSFKGLQSIRALSIGNDREKNKGSK